ncbi:hypothetical protein XELAEV_18047064mg [Xenopus laevis]|uniref:Helix-turn-helix domain-containing protein n=1 Tax=Xenopus laevis TaxID=8355 RepID=A0A974H175_XENLA|nr:hypothetical protein XELAEV_18047064mg [Xenopus laevis]
MDDILVIWDGPLSGFEDMVRTANQAHPTIKFTTEIGAQKINFLDVTITIENGFMNTNLYRKSTDKNNILHASSYHTPNVIRAIPKGQFIRARRISTQKKEYTVASNTLKERFIKRGYKPKLIDTCAKEVQEMPRENLLTYKTKNEQKCLPFVSQFNKNSKDIERIVHRY